MADKVWKAVERRICKVLGGQRTPLSGGASGHTRGDCINVDEYVEIKHRARIPFFAEWKRTVELAKKESKTPIMVIHEKGSQINLVIMDLKDYAKLKDGE